MASMAELVGLHAFTYLQAAKCCKVLEWLTKDMMTRWYHEQAGE